MIWAEIYVALAVFFLARKDAWCFRLKDNSEVTSPEVARNIRKWIDKWHDDGAFLFMLFVLPLAATKGWLIVPYSILIRLALFDLTFNKFAGLDIKHIGDTAFTDRFFRKIFGEKGAVKKSIFFLVLLIVLNFIFK